MKFIGIVAEYNPFHRGHLYHIGETRRLVSKQYNTGTAVVCVMSGNFVQRGELAVMPKHARAEAAVRTKGGPDLIVELPAAYACATAERFAGSAVGLLESLGVLTHLSFGSECGELEGLRRVAEALDRPEFSEHVREGLDAGATFAAARQSAVERMLGEEGKLLSEPNNILGIEYLRALKRTGSAMEPLTVKRKGAAHDDPSPDEQYDSAAHLRDMLLSGGAYSALRRIPFGAAEIVLSQMFRGSAPMSIRQCDMAVMAALRRLSAEDFKRVADVSEGLENRLYKAVKSASTLAECADMAKTKRYTHARIRRILLSAYLGITEELAVTPPQYVKVLAFNDTGREALRQIEKKCRLPLLVKPSDAKELPPQALRMFEHEALATELYMLACPSPSARRAATEWTTSPVFVKQPG